MRDFAPALDVDLPTAVRLALPASTTKSHAATPSLPQASGTRHSRCETRGGSQLLTSFTADPTANAAVTPTTPSIPSAAAATWTAEAASDARAFDREPYVH